MNLKKIAANLLIKPVLYPGQLFRPNTYIGADMYYRLAKLANPRAMSMRKPERWTSPPGRRLEPARGFDVWDLSNDPVVSSAIGTGLKDLDHRMAHDEDRLDGKPFLQIFPIRDLRSPRNAPYMDLVKHPEILGTVAEYLGVIPVLQQVALWYSPNVEEVGRSQLYHLDSMDVKQVKVFIFMEEIMVSSGPLHVVRSDESYRVWKHLRQKKKVKEKSEKFRDAEIFEALGEDTGVALTGKAGTTALVDTCNCYHYGSRPTGERSMPRKILFLHYTTPFARNRKFIDSAYAEDIDKLLGLGPDAEPRAGDWEVSSR